MRSLVLPLQLVDMSDIPRVGGKAASLGTMMSVNIPVPPGFVITTAAYAKGMTPALRKAVLGSFDELGVKRVAVRSSAVAEDSGGASWAGQLETYLNVGRGELINAVKKCWTSVESEHAQAYGAHHGLGKDDQAVGVVVQAMVDSEVSGVMFTVNPVTNNHEELVIESIYGLGELIVQGAVTPENVVVNKKSGEIVAQSPSRQQKMLVYRSGRNQEVKIPAAQLRRKNLSEQQLKDLHGLASKIEQYYGHPQDIEWALANKKMYIVQSRPITTLADPEEVPAFTYEKLFTREESLMFGEIEYEEFVHWLAQITDELIPPTVCRINKGLLEVWLCRESTNIFVDEIYRRNISDKNYLKQNVALYKNLIAQMLRFEKRGHARDITELKQYLELFRRAIIPLHVIFFTPFREDTPKPLFGLAMKIRTKDAMFDNSDLFVRNSLVYIYPECNGVETMIGLKDLDSPELKKIKERENNFFWAENQYLNMNFDRFQERYPVYNLLIDEVTPDQKVITGTVAFRGRVTGLVQVISRKKDIATFKEGSVLVAPMTTPHYLPAMRTAKAFVTDEGGVTCHAAIVSRELKTPCIIGTRVATQVLQDDDVVVVDAYKGKVIKL